MTKGASMAGKTGGEGGARGGTAAPLIDPLLQSFAERYVYPWSERALGVDDLPFDLPSRIEEAAELFERGRQRWRTFDVLAKEDRARRARPRDFEGKQWTDEAVESAREAHKALTRARFDLSKPDELPLHRLRAMVNERVSDATLYASVAMRCAQDAADECYRLSSEVEIRARRAYKADLMALYESDSEQWFVRMRYVLRDLAGEVSTALEHVATRLGAARTALALASATENMENLDAGERDYVALWRQHSANLKALSADRAPSALAGKSRYFTGGDDLGAPDAAVDAVLAEKAVLKQENIQHREKEATRRAALKDGNRKAAEATEKAVRAAWAKDWRSNPTSTLTNRYARMQVALASEKAGVSRYKNTLGEPLTAGAIRGVLKRLGLLKNKSQRDCILKV